MSAPFSAGVGKSAVVSSFLPLGYRLLVDPIAPPYQNMGLNILATEPITIVDWKSLQGDPSSTIIRTQLGEPPFPARRGSGYWPGPDPPGGLDFHAKKEMELYGSLVE